MLHIKHKLRRHVAGAICDTRFVHMALRTTLPVADDVPQLFSDDTLTQQPLVEALQTHGVAVVNNVLPEADCDAFQYGMQC